MLIKTEYDLYSISSNKLENDYLFADFLLSIRNTIIDIQLEAYCRKDYELLIKIDNMGLNYSVGGERYYDNEFTTNLANMINNIRYFYRTLKGSIDMNHFQPYQMKWIFDSPINIEYLKNNFFLRQENIINFECTTLITDCNDQVVPLPQLYKIMMIFQR